MKLSTFLINGVRTVKRVSFFTPRNSIVVIDNYRSNLFRDFKIENEPIKDFSICYLRGEKIYLDCVLFVIFRKILGLGLRGDYIRSFLVLSGATNALSYIDDSASLYLVASSLPNVKFYIFQNGIRDLLELEEIRRVLSKASSLNCSNVLIHTHGRVATSDYRLVFGESGANIKEFGSLASSAIIYDSNVEDNSSKAIFISQYRKFETVYSGTDFPVKFDDFYEPERKALPLIQKYLNKCGILMDVLLSNSWQTGVHNHEQIFFGDLLDPRTEFVKSDLTKSDLHNYELIITVDSTLGFELASIGKKVLFVDLRLKGIQEIRKARSLERMFLSSNARLFWDFVITEYFELEEKIDNFLSIDSAGYSKIWNDECSDFLMKIK